MSDYEKLISMFDGNSDFKPLVVRNMNLSTGEIEMGVSVDESLYYKMLSKECGQEICDDFCLMRFVKGLVKDKQEYDKIKTALDMVKETGYGIVNPTVDDLVLEQP
jgi:stage IV sporulation protein A